MTSNEFAEEIEKLEVIGGRWRYDEGKELTVMFWKENGLSYPAKGDKHVESSMDELSTENGRKIVWEKIKEKFS